MENRDYQDKCHQAIKSEYIKGINRQLVAMATGTGKTVVFSQLPDRVRDVLPGQTIITAHREELIDQAVSSMREINPHLKIDKEKAEHYADPNADVIVSSIQTIGRAGAERLKRFNWERFDKFINDEAHHSVAQSYLNFYESAGVLRRNDALLLGVTATPQRSDGQALARIYQRIVFSYSMRQAIEDGWLVDVRGVRVRTDTSLDAVRTVGGDFNEGDLADVVNNPKRNQRVVKAWLDHGENRQTVVFTVDIQHACDLAEMFRHYGVRAEAVWGADKDRAAKLARHRRLETTVLLNCGVLTEGYDDWQIGCILLARPTKSGVLFTQMVGRGTRLQAGTGNLKNAIRTPIRCPDKKIGCVVAHYAPIKQDCIVIDVLDLSNKHTLVTLPTLMGMNARVDLKGGSLVKAIQRIEEVQKQYPNLDYSQLEDISQLNSWTERVDLFDIKFTEDVEQNSDLTWHPAADGGYVLLLPNKSGQIKLQQNMLDEWEIQGAIHGQKYRGIRKEMGEAFSAADELALSKVAGSEKVLKQEQEWHDDPPTEKQLNMLRKFMRGTPIPADLTKGQASRLIGNFIARKA